MLKGIGDLDKNVGILHELATEPTIANARGYREEVNDINELKDTNVISPIEMLTPGSSRGDDSIRVSIAVKQACHTIPIEDASYCLVSNGYDEAIQFNLSDDFVINAEEDGKVIDINEELGFEVVQYKSGKSKAISMRPEIVHNAGAGFYMPNQMKLVHTKVGETFKKDEPLAYHEKFFKYSKMHGLRYAFGPLTKIGIMSMYSTYEDAGICSEDFGKRMKTAIVYQEIAKLKKNNNVIYMAKVGDHVGIGDALIKYDIATEDNEIAKYLSKLSADNAALLEEETKSELKSMHAGKIIDIKIYTLLPPEDLSESLGKIVQDYFDMAKKKKDYLSKFDDSDGVMKAGYMLTDSAEVIKNKYNSIKGNKGCDVLIEYYIEHEDILGIGDKIAIYGPNKQVVSETISEGYEMFSEFRPEEEVSLLLTPGTISRRMTISIVPIMCATKVLIELKRKIQDMIKY